MADPMLSESDIARMQTPLWAQARQAFEAGRADDGSALLDKAVDQWRSLKDYSINWITALLTFIGEELGEDAVERALRKAGDEVVRPRRDTGTDLGALAAAGRAKVIARGVVSNNGAGDAHQVPRQS